MLDSLDRMLGGEGAKTDVIRDRDIQSMDDTTQDTSTEVTQASDERQSATLRYVDR